MPNVAIKIQDLTKIYEDNVVALDDVSLEIYEGEIFSLLGPNGAGKTTLIKIITGQLEPTKGDVWVLGVHHKEFLKSPTRLRISYVPQENIIWEELTVKENMLFMASMYKLPRREAKQRVKELLEDFELFDVRKRLAAKLSGGMKRKLAIAMALINDPEILILDEPTAGLDPRVRAILLSDIEKFKKTGKTILLTTHIVEEAERLSTRVGIINRGKIVAIDSPSELKKRACGIEILDLLFRKLNEELVKRLVSLVGKDNYVIVGDRVLIKENNFIELINEIRNDPKLFESLLNTAIRKSNLEDAFLFLTGTSLGGE